jgi:prepilin peptidase CpaA
VAVVPAVDRLAAHPNSVNSDSGVPLGAGGGVTAARAGATAVRRTHLQTSPTQADTRHPAVLPPIPIDPLAVTLFFGLVALAAINDVAELRIPNRISATIAALYPVHVLAALEPPAWPVALGLASLVFAVGVALFACRVLGGGDVKLLAAITLWAGPLWLADFLIATAVAGGLLALLMMSPLRFSLALALSNFGAREASETVLGRNLPYGVAIAAGAFLAMGPALLT